jgi:pilus assembly protein Flp/PilA
MKKCKDLLVRLGRDEEGAAMIEYSILIGLIAATVITAVVAVGVWINGRWQSLCTALGLTCT